MAPHTNFDAGSYGVANIENQIKSLKKEEE
jgi:hypothetical protein